jgi:ribosomal protein L37E
MNGNGRLLLLMMVLLMMMLLYRSPEVYCRQQCEYVCLKEGYQQFQAAHEYCKRNGYDRDPQAQSGVYLCKDKDQTKERESDDVTCRYVGKKSYHQNEGPQEDPEYLYRREHPASRRYASSNACSR